MHGVHVLSIFNSILQFLHTDISEGFKQPQFKRIPNMKMSPAILNLRINHPCTVQLIFALLQTASYRQLGFTIDRT